MSDLFRRTPVPAWKNSPLKTVPEGFRKVAVTDRPKRQVPSMRVQNVSITSEEMRTMLKDVPNMFDDDEDNNVIESEGGKNEAFSDAGSHNPNEMELMFASPEASMLRDRPIEVTEDNNENEDIDASIENIEQAGPEPPTHSSSSANIRKLLQSAAEQAEKLQLERQKETVDITHVLQNHPEFIDSVRFLARFEEEFESKFDARYTHEKRTPNAAGSENEYEEKILHKLDSYVKLPAGALYTMVLRQHQEIVETGLFGES